MSFFDRKRLAIALAVSLGLNLFAAGFLVARALNPRQRHGAVADMHSPRALMRAAREAGVREPARRAMRSHRPEFRARRAAMREARREVFRALKAEPFDRGAFERALAQLQSRTGDTQRALHAAFADLASELSPQQRKAMARAIGKARRDRGKRRGKGPRRPLD